MKLQRQKSDYKRGYTKYTVVLPKEAVEQAGFKEGDELEVEAKKGKIELEKKSI